MLCGCVRAECKQQRGKLAEGTAFRDVVTIDNYLESCTDCTFAAVWAEARRLKKSLTFAIFVDKVVSSATVGVLSSFKYFTPDNSGNEHAIICHPLRGSTMEVTEKEINDLKKKFAKPDNRLEYFLLVMYAMAFYVGVGFFAFLVTGYIRDFMIRRELENRHKRMCGVGRARECVIPHGNALNTERVCRKSNKDSGVGTE
eukprot:GHVS01100701.1.p1 GENE.GHVS01100701.1~~GHVS01100701.1.p1  ORF type:complete len:200 (-),score=11.92 GHVS01100701.1:154-753(-)